MRVFCLHVLATLASGVEIRGWKISNLQARLGGSLLRIRACGPG